MINEHINCELFNIQYNQDNYTLKKTHDEKKQYYMILSLKKFSIDVDKINIQFKINTIGIKSVEFFIKNKLIKITKINSDGFLFSFDFDVNNSKIEIKFIPFEHFDLTNLPMIFIRKILFKMYKMNELVSINWDNIFIINLKRRNDRKMNMINNISKLNTNYEFIDALDGTETSIIKMFDEYKNKTNIISSGHFACLLSHIKAIELAKSRKYSNIMILEDDVFFCDDFINKIKKIKIPPYDMIYLGGITKRKKIFFSDWAKTKNIMGAYAYILNYQMFDIVLKELNKFINYVDLFYMNKIQPNYNVYILNDFVKTNLDSSDTSNKTNIMIQRLSYIK